MNIREEFSLYLDESGSPKPSPNDQTAFFAMGGVIIRRGQENNIKLLLDEFKNKWNINLNIPLHGTDMRSKKKNFRFLENLSQNKLNDFYRDLHSVVLQSDVIIHGCVISRQGYIDRYKEKYGTKTWEMMKSSFSILIERSAKYVNKQKGKLMVYYEKAGRTEDKQIQEYFQDIRKNGLPFNKHTSQKYNPYSSNSLSTVLSGIEGKSKNNPVMQIADYCLHPIADMKKHPNNRAYKYFQNKKLIVDSNINTEEIEEIGIKYYCYK